jgi:hypothetical protein
MTEEVDMSIDKNPDVLFDALVIISKGKSTPAEAKEMAKKALYEYGGGDVRLTTKTGIFKVKAALFTTITHRSTKLEESQYTSVYVLGIPFDTDKEYRNVEVEFYNGETTSFILETPKRTLTSLLKEELKEQGIGWFLKNNSDYKYWPTETIEKTQFDSDNRKIGSGLVAVQWDFKPEKFRHGYIVL